MIDLHDRGFTLGDGLFETVLAEDGILRNLPEHLARMSTGCAVLGLEPPDAGHALAIMLEALEAASLTDMRAAVRLTLSAGRGGRGLERPATVRTALVATAAPSPKPEAPAVVVTSSVRRNAASPTSRIKSLSYLDNVLARREAREAGADEALMLNTSGELACAAAANLFWVKAGRIFTPQLECGVLPGIARAGVIAWAAAAGEPVSAVRAGPDALKGAEAIFLTNSLIGLRPVAKLDGRDVRAWDGLATIEAAVSSSRGPRSTSAA